MSYIGDYAEDYATLNFMFTTVAGNGTPTALVGGAIYVYTATEKTLEGVTLTLNYDGLTGFNKVVINLSANPFYEVGKDYYIVISAGTVDGVSVVGYVVGSFSIQNRYMRGTDGAAPSGEYNTQMARITANVATEAKQDIMQISVDWIEAISKNKKILNVATSKWELYNAAGDAIILRWDALDKNGDAITCDAGVPTQLGVPY